MLLPPLSVVDVVGGDAAKILSNLTTNNLEPLASASPDSCEGVETFVTNVKGRCLGHVMAYPIENGIRLVGARGQSEAIVSQIDRYTIREDATPTIRDSDFSATLDPDPPGCVFQCEVPWLGDQPTTLSLVSDHDGADQDTSDVDGEHADESMLTDPFHRERIMNLFPWFGVDVTDSNLPQEAGRDSKVISFTKGCYLGQETVARLDARGRVQKMLTRVQLTGLPEAISLEQLRSIKLLPAGEGEMPKQAMRLTSVSLGDPTWAIAMTRRSHFDAGSRGTAHVDGCDINATVMPPEMADQQS